MGNGLLTFIEHKTEMSDFFKNNEIVTYHSIEDLSQKIIFYKKNDKLRKKIANNGRIKYFKLFNELRTTKYILDRSFGKDVHLY